jgi:hypothetical protein
VAGGTAEGQHQVLLLVWRILAEVLVVAVQTHVLAVQAL